MKVYRPVQRSPEFLDDRLLLKFDLKVSKGEFYAPLSFLLTCCRRGVVAARQTLVCGLSSSVSEIGIGATTLYLAPLMFSIGLICQVDQM